MLVQQQKTWPGDENIHQKWEMEIHDRLDLQGSWGRSHWLLNSPGGKCPLNNSIIYHGISICHYQSARQKTSQTYHGHWLFVRFYSFFFLELLIYKKQTCMYGSLAAVYQEFNITQMWLYLFASPNVSGHTRSCGFSWWVFPSSVRKAFLKDLLYEEWLWEGPGFSFLRWFLLNCKYPSRLYKLALFQCWKSNKLDGANYVQMHQTCSFVVIFLLVWGMWNFNSGPLFLSFSQRMYCWAFKGSFLFFAFSMNK